ncbi:MAG TPA: UDP-N-acetylglucosamine 2-epimerase (non-hydrolyzing), partial [Bacteroidia bacterium]|nr:UDP-N-acetylglucosamine 2-epimerase (non-hydrolyzing) [Bacteroidia bacterium]
KMNIKIAHIESGLRSLDRTMPEEINRILTDEITDYFFITEQSGYDNLLKEGKKQEQLFFVGNTMIDTLVAFADKIRKNNVLVKYELDPKEYVLMTMHRPATVDHHEGLSKLIDIIEFVCQSYKVVFPIHPRTLHRLEKFGLKERISSLKKLILTEPLDYFSFQKLTADCKMVLTDSGGIQEETTFRQVPCLTLRANTERPSTVTIGSNELIPFDLEVILKKIETIKNGTYKKGNVPPYWDGNSTKRILEACQDIFSDDLKKANTFTL